jgi:hypothetical protein
VKRVDAVLAGEFLGRNVAVGATDRQPEPHSGP